MNYIKLLFQDSKSNISFYTYLEVFLMVKFHHILGYDLVNQNDLDI